MRFALGLGATTSSFPRKCRMPLEDAKTFKPSRRSSTTPSREAGWKSPQRWRARVILTSLDGYFFCWSLGTPCSSGCNLNHEAAFACGTVARSQAVRYVVVSSVGGDDPTMHFQRCSLDSSPEVQHSSWTTQLATSL